MLGCKKKLLGGAAEISEKEKGRCFVQVQRKRKGKNEKKVGQTEENLGVPRRDRGGEWCAVIKRALPEIDEGNAAGWES